jgi:cytochrome c oxidase cbb3-type subunit III
MRIELVRGRLRWAIPVASMLLVACPSGSEKKGKTDSPVVASSVEAPVPKTMRSVKSSAPAIAAGKATFAATCVACHGKDGEGRIGMGPKLNSKTFLAAASDDMLIRTISDGRAGTTMISWKASLKPAQVNEVVSYMRSWQNVPAAKLNESPVKGNATAGGKMYFSVCSGCHGRTGAGYQETANGTGIGRRAFLASVTTGYLRYVIRHGKSGTKMRPFAGKNKVAVANLSDAEIENVIAYLRDHAW